MAFKEMTNPSHGWTRLDGVDLLRGFAIFFVLMNHVNMRLLGAHVPYMHGLRLQVVYSLFWNGQFGVQMFFAVSGFLITAMTLRRWGSPATVNLRGFYWLRFARIVPLLLLLLAVLSALHLAHVRDFVVSSKTGGLGRALFAALTFHVNLLEARRGYLPAGWDILWSLSVEEVFYLFFPLACLLFRRTRFLVAPLLLFVVLGPFARSHAFNHNPVWREYSYLGGMDAIALGCLTALVLAGRRVSRAALWICGAGGAVLTIFSLCFSVRAYAWGLGRNGLNMTVLAVGTCMLIAVFAQSEWKAPRAFAPLLVLGRRSYETYLTHLLVVLGLFSLFLAAGKSVRYVPVLFIGSIVFSGVLGEVVARFYSEPINRWLRRRWNGVPTPRFAETSDNQRDTAYGSNVTQ
ncbi:acyltransferase [Edaphobacter acidisoli]|uniref:Acyltransferase n=2 Tax=Edaphobacter acidisoli TaxID=2040573 RepID=A0A916RX16_9BACT|nr:acyltransferase [Edaphobacter acidisoli]